MSKYGSVVKRLAASVDYWAQVSMRQFVLDVDRRMRAQDISRSALAGKLQSSQAYVTKVMRGDVNFTLETMTKLALAVGGRLQIEIVDKAFENRPTQWVAASRAFVARTDTLRIVAGDVANNPRFTFERVFGRAA